MKLLSLLLPALSLWSCIHVASAKVALPKWFGPGMVLQTNAEYGAHSFLNGKAAPGEIVSVNLITRRVATLKAEADLNGDWLIQLDPAYAYGGSLTINVTGNRSNNTVTATNVTFGDVFLCSGQSNMVYPLKDAFNATQEAETLKQYPNFRFFVTSRASSDHPRWDLPSHGACDVGSKCNRWITQQEALNDGFILDFSAVCFMTVRDIAKMQKSIGSKRPVALIQMAWSGTRVEAWMSKRAIASTRFASQVPGGSKSYNNATVLYNAMAHPWRHYAIRAVLWYQGEANANQRIEGIDQTEYYATMYQAMIADWRLLKGMGDFAWGTVQLPPSVASGTDPKVQTGRMEIRVAQAETAPHKNGLTDISAVAVTLDLGGRGPWGIDHPPNKNEISRRLALGLLHAAYAAQTPLWTGPVLHGAYHQQKNDTIVITFSKAGSSMSLRDVNALNSNGTSNGCHKCCAKAPPFEVRRSKAGANNDHEGGQWQTVPRDAISIRDNSVILDVSAANLHVGTSAMEVRYAWTDYVECVLENSDGLVASPFVHRINEESKQALLLRRSGKQQTSAMTHDNTGGTFHPSSIQTPPMGFNSWNFYHCNIDENTVKAIADAMAENGMKSVGYRYVNIDDCWQVQRFPNGGIQEDPARFPSGMKALADYVHSKGLLFGVYTARGSRTCQNRPASYMHEEIDAQTYCDWGVDFLKMDNCGGDNWKQANTSWVKFRKEFDACQERTGRPTVLSVAFCESVTGCGEWIAKTANLWRTTDDIQATWKSVQQNIHKQEPMYKIAKPGHFNDPDMLQVGNVGLTIDEQYSHMSLWCVTGAPLLVGTDLEHTSNKTLAILTNPEVTAVNQDLGWKKNQVQGRIIRKASDDSSEVWAKRLVDGSWAVVLLNLLDDKSISVVVRWYDLALSNSTRAVVRDLWLREDVGRFSNEYTTENLRPHASKFLRIFPGKNTDIITEIS